MIELSENIKLYANDDLWIEGDAVNQLHKVAELEGVEEAVGFPDLHPGKDGPVGAAFASEGIFYPHLIGNDIGCGMGLWRTSLKANKIKRDKWVKKLTGLEHPWDGDINEWLEERGEPLTPFDQALGIIGGGNHFAELQKVEKVLDDKEFEAIGLDNKNLVLLVHSGSRAFGEQILRRHVDVNRHGGLLEDSEDSQAYIAQHDSAVKWAVSNRALIAYRFVLKLGGKCEPVLDVEHNSISKFKDGARGYWLHRKGVVPSNKGPVVIPGSRGTLSYIVQPVGDHRNNLYSLVHGAGRKWNRSSCKGKLKGKYRAESLTHTSLGSAVICDDKELLYEEAPQAYKNIDAIIEYLQSEGLIKVIATLRPVITYKMRKKR